MTRSEGAQLALYRALPDNLLPGDFKGRLLVNFGLRRAKKNKGKPRTLGKGQPYEFESRILNTPGTSQSLYQYLNGAGASKLPEIVGAQLGKHWYTPFAKLFSRLPFGRNIVIDKIMDKTLPKINGSTDIAKQYLYAGGMV